MTGTRRSACRGAAMLEFALVGVPMLFTLMSIFEITRGMWTYQNLSYAVREGTRYAAMHGAGCKPPNTCQITIGQITSAIRAAAPGIDPTTTTLTFTPASGSITTGMMSSLQTNNTIWPPNTANAQLQTVRISAKYPFRSFLTILWLHNNQSKTYYLRAASAEGIQY